jgi:hypothetical protein
MNAENKQTEDLEKLLLISSPAEVRDLAKTITANTKLSEMFIKVFTFHTDEENIEWDDEQGEIEFLEMVGNKITAMDDFSLENGGDERTLGYALKAKCYGDDVLLEFIIIDKLVGNILWDTWEGKLKNPVIKIALAGFYFSVINYSYEIKKLGKKEPPLFNLHPERFKSYYDFSEDISKLYRHEVDQKTGIMTLEQLQKLTSKMIESCNKNMMSYPLVKRRDSQGNVNIVIDNVTGLSCAYGRYVQAGRQILKFPKELVELLKETDADDIPMNLIKLPYSSQYLHFGVQRDLEIEPGWFVDGMYIESLGEPGDLRFAITACPEDHSKMSEWFLHAEPFYEQSFYKDYRSVDIGTAIDMVFSNRISELKNVKKIDMSKSGLNNVVDVSEKNAEIRIANATRGLAVFKKAVEIGVNALCYVTAYPDDIYTEWPEGTPESLSKKADTLTGKQSLNAISKLRALGFTKVHICGRNLAEEMRKGKLEGSVKSKSEHWRRGHWRNQVHGTGRLLRKLIWVMPALIGRGSKKDNVEPNGHIYMVS